MKPTGDIIICRRVRSWTVMCAQGSHCFSQLDQNPLSSHTVAQLRPQKPLNMSVLTWFIQPKYWLDFNLARGPGKPSFNFVVCVLVFTAAKAVIIETSVRFDLLHLVSQNLR